MIISKIKKKMKDKKIKIRDLSSTGLSSATLAKARTDDGILECRLSTLIRIADALGVDVKETFEKKKEGEHYGQKI